jgi:hypothetical protein
MESHHDAFNAVLSKMMQGQELSLEESLDIAE